MSAILNATPQPNLQGARDQSSTASQAVAETLPQFLPHIFFFAQKGKAVPALVDGNSFEQLYGIKTLDATQPYYNHASALAQEVFANGGSIMAQRLIPADAAKATISVGIDLLPVQVLVPGNANPVSGYQGMIVVDAVPSGTLGQAVVGAGSQTGTGGTQSTFYPLFEMAVSSEGDDGNNQGMAISVPTLKSVIPADQQAITTMGAYIYDFRMVSRTDPSVTGQTVPSFRGSQRVPFTLAPDSYYKATNSQYAMAKSLLQAYNPQTMPGTVPVVGNFDQLYTYQANIDTVLGLIMQAEIAAGNHNPFIQGGTGVYMPVHAMGIAAPNLSGVVIPGPGNASKYMVNLFGATDLGGTPYLTYTLLGSMSGGTIFTDSTVNYAAGGSDGTITPANLDTLVQQELLGYNASTYVFTDMGMWPQSWFIDSGFTIATKEAAGNILATRKDMGVIVATQDVSLPQNTAEQDSSTAIALSSSLSQYTESQVYGTPVCRAVVSGQSGYRINSTYTGLLPLSIDIAGKMAAYMGAGNGNWTPGKDFTRSPLNKCTTFYGVNATSKTYEAYAADWATNLVWAQTYDRGSIFYPAFQTVYDDDTSVLNSLKVVCAVIELEKVAFRTWRDLTGRDDLTKDQLIKESNKKIAAQVPRAKFDNNFTVVPDTYFSSADAARNYSWSCDMALYANPMFTVGTFTIDARNMSALSASAP